MSTGKRLLVTLALLALSAGVAAPDTIVQTDAQGQRQVVQAQAIVVRDDASEVVYKHFDLKQRLVMKVQLNQATLPYQIARSSGASRRQIVELWKQFGYTATVTDQAGKKTTVYDAYLDFFPPPGGVFLEPVPPRAALPLLLTKGGADEMDFSDVAAVQIHGDELTVTLANGRIETGKLIPPTSRPAAPSFMGITDRYAPDSENVYDFSLPLTQIRQIHFENH
ncbi:MAG: hypothetical protein ACRD10_09125 [Terriglobia bacterium]